MYTNQINPISILPLNIEHNDTKYTVEVLGKAIPSGKFFTCEIKGLGIYIIEAIANPLTKRYTWVTDNEGANAQLMSLIRQEIEKQLRAA